MKYFSDLESIREAELEELEKVDGLDKKSAKSVYDFFHK